GGNTNLPAHVRNAGAGRDGERTGAEEADVGVTGVSPHRTGAGKGDYAVRHSARADGPCPVVYNAAVFDGERGRALLADVKRAATIFPRRAGATHGYIAMAGRVNGDRAADTLRVASEINPQ